MSARWPSTLNEVVSWAMVNRSRWVCVTCGSRSRAWRDLLRELLFARLPLLVEAFGIRLVGHAALDDGHALPRVGDAVHVHAEGEAVEKLRPQIALLGVHGAHQHEAGRMAEADPLALDHVDAHRRRIQQQIDHVIVEQVDLVHVEQAAIGRRQHARLEVALAVLDGRLDVQRADDPIFGRADRQVHEAGAPRGSSAASRRAPGGRGSCRTAMSRPLGSQENGQSATTSISGSSAARARAAVDLAVPRSPRISTPPMPLLMAFRIRARFMRSWPTMAVKG